MSNLFPTFNSSSKVLELLKTYKTHYPELDVFRHQIDNVSYHHAYVVQKRKALTYQIIFSVFSLLFFALGLIIYFKTTNGMYSLYFGNSEFAKGMALFSCFGFSFGSLGLVFLPRPEKEAVQHLYDKTEQRLTDIYHQVCMQTGAFSLPPFQNRQPGFSFRKVYQETKRKVQERKEKTLQLLECISYANHLDRSAKEHLFNQALFELQDKFNLVVHAFNKQIRVNSKV